MGPIITSLPAQVQPRPVHAQRVLCTPLSSERSERRGLPSGLYAKDRASLTDCCQALPAHYLPGWLITLYPASTSFSPIRAKM